jgi:hypothetical protein
MFAVGACLLLAHQGRRQDVAGTTKTVDDLSDWSLREQDLPGITPVIVWYDSLGHRATIEEMVRSPGHYIFTFEDRDSVPKRAIELNESGVREGVRSDFHKSLEHFRQAHLAAPRWAQPVYQGAWTALLFDKTDLARGLYAWTDRMEPGGYWTAKIALDCLNREVRGEYPPGLYKAYVMTEGNPDRLNILEQLVKQFPTFAPAWQNLATSRQSLSGREQAIAKGLASIPDPETKAALALQRAQVLTSKGDHDGATALLRELIDGRDGTIQSREVARCLLLRIKSSLGDRRP